MLTANTSSHSLCSIVVYNVVAGILCCLHEVAEDGSPPGPVIVGDDVG